MRWSARQRAVPHHVLPLAIPLRRRETELLELAYLARRKLLVIEHPLRGRVRSRKNACVLQLTIEERQCRTTDHPAGTGTGHVVPWADVRADIHFHYLTRLISYCLSQF